MVAAASAATSNECMGFIKSPRSNVEHPPSSKPCSRIAAQKGWWLRESAKRPAELCSLRRNADGLGDQMLNQSPSVRRQTLQITHADEMLAPGAGIAQCHHAQPQRPAVHPCGDEFGNDGYDIVEWMA